jgi:F-type H+-transporting ATPase subunit b
MKAFFTLLAATGHKAPPLVDLDTTVFVQFGIFLFLMVILTRLVFRPYLALRAERTRSIDGAREEADRLSEDAAEKLSTYEAQIAKARKEAATVRAEVRAEGESLASQRLKTAHGESEAKVEAARHKIRKTAEAAQLALRTRADQIARSIASKLLGREV